jgi:hypothetical protein
LSPTVKNSEDMGDEDEELAFRQQPAEKEEEEEEEGLLDSQESTHQAGANILTFATNLLDEVVSVTLASCHLRD